MKPIYKLIRQPSFKPGHAMSSSKDYSRTKSKLVLLYKIKCISCGEYFESEDKEDIYCCEACAFYE
jgi:hypothetical protein